MKTNQYFSFSRIGMVMKRDFMENWKRNLYVFLGIFLAFLGVYLFNMNEYNDEIHGGILDAYQTKEIFLNHHIASFAGILLLLSCYFASEVMRSMCTKESRLSFLMLPATLLEKFVARALYVILGLFLNVFLTSLLAEFIHFAFMPLFDELPDKFKFFMWPEIWGKFFADFYKPTTVIIKSGFFGGFMIGSVGVVWVHSLFILGGNFFRKYPFFKSCGVMLLFTILFVWVIKDVNFGILAWLNDSMMNNKDWMNEHVVGGTITFILLCFTILNWWLSYKLFIRRQVIEPKFRLL